MTADQARDEMMAVLLAAWPGGAATLTFSDVPAQAAEQSWARAILRHAEGRLSSLADATSRKRWTMSGTLWVQVFAPVGDGNTTLYARAQTVLNAYRDAAGSVLYRNHRMREVPTTGAHSQINVLIDFSYDEVR